jgi:hypothetical protein
MHCKCERPECGWEWDSFRRDKKTGKLISVKPERCARCKYLSWNKEDRRRKNPGEFAPPDPVLLLANGKVPELNTKGMLEALIEAKDILEYLVTDYGPSDHPKVCVGEESKVLAKVNRQIEMLTRLTGTKKPNAIAKAE